MGELQENQEGKLPLHAHRSPQQLNPVPLILDVPDHPSLPSVRGRLSIPASEALVLKVGWGGEERL